MRWLIVTVTLVLTGCTSLTDSVRDIKRGEGCIVWPKARYDRETHDISGQVKLICTLDTNITWRTKHGQETKTSGD